MISYILFNFIPKILIKIIYINHKVSSSTLYFLIYFTLVNKFSKDNWGFNPLGQVTEHIPIY